jgi:hypothetical protein
VCPHLLTCLLERGAQHSSWVVFFPKERECGLSPEGSRPHQLPDTSLACAHYTLCASRAKREQVVKASRHFSSAHLER